MRVAVFGAGGFLGRHIVSQLNRPDTVCISSSDSHFDAASGLLADDLAVDGNVDAAIYLSQSPRYRDVPQHAAHLWCVNVVSAIKAAEWARRRGARRFLYASSGTVYAPGFHPFRETDPVRRDRWYALSKIQAEEALQRFSPELEVTSARLFAVYGPGQRGKLIPNLIATIQAGDAVSIQSHPFDEADRQGLRLSMIHVVDAAAIMIRLLDESGPTVCNVASPEVLSIAEIATAIGRQLGKTPDFETAASRDSDSVADVSEATALLERPFASFHSAIREVVHSIAT